MENQVEDKLEGKAIICMLKTNVHDHTIYRIRLDELHSLVETLGITVVGEVIQSRYRPFSKFFFGSGKVKEVARKVRRLNADLVIFYNILKSSQKLNLIRAFNCEVIDRYELTLEIFDRMASDNLSKLQIQAARLDKQAPFAKLQASINYRQDRPFFRSGGEYGFHGQLREITRNQARIRQEINRLMEDQNQRIFNRKRLGYPVICIAGFYNAGKTSLFNAITGDNKLVSDRPFTTLSSKYQRRFIDYETTVLFIDTIGFVLDLDPRLIQSFKLNLLDMRSADIVILLLEIDDPVITLNMKLSEGIRLLKEIGIPHERIIVVFNKLDKTPELEQEIGKLSEISRYDLPWISVSALEKRNLQELLSLIAVKVKYLEENPPFAPEIPVFQKAETMVNRVLANYPSNFQSSRRDPFRSLVSTVLSQNTNGRNQATAYARLKRRLVLLHRVLMKRQGRRLLKPSNLLGCIIQEARH
jgi:GTP-binding protein HflX